MINVEIDGKLVETERGSTVMDAAHKAGVHIPHFCYHKKLSIAANCRMCLVEVEKAPKPLPACATPAADGMKVHTHSEMAVKAQKGVMEFLLINHPLDCPICDQGGECMLQDVAMGYGGTASRYSEEKRIVMHKDIGALISTVEMSRCIQCTRCVRFGQEIAGMMELGMAFRGEHAEIMSFVDSSVDSELSGNMIDLCPVGALTSKPFRYTARNWELSRRKSVSPHDGLGSNLAVQVKNNKVMRVLPVENEAINECWISDKDRFSYEGLNPPERLTKPMLKQDNKWLEVEWPVALEYVAHGLRQIAHNHGAEQIAALATPHSTLEELYLLQKLVRGLGSGNVDFRLRQSDFSLDGKQAGAPWLGMPVADINTRDRLLIVGSFLRKDHPLLAQRVRQAVKSGAQANIVHASDDDLLMPVANKAIVAPGELVNMLAQILKALAAQKQGSAQGVENVTVGSEAAAIARSLASGERAAVLLGNFAQQHPQATQIALLAERIAGLCGAKFGFLGEAANSVGGYLAGAVPFGPANEKQAKQGMNAAQMVASPRKAYLLLNVEPELDMQNPQQAMTAMYAADMVVALSAYKHHATNYADVLLPIAPFTETSGTFVNTEGRVQSFKGAVKPLGEARPAWKVLRVLGNVLDVQGFEYDTSEEVRDAMLSGQNVADKLNNHIEGVALQAVAGGNSGGLQRVADVPIYSADAVVRRAASLQKTRDAATPCVTMRGSELQKLGVQSGDAVRVTQGNASVRLTALADDSLPAGVARVAAGHPATAELGAMFGSITVERA
ncbi:MAG: NADH-quinone oxidoreductase subunit G [Gallionellales bacterium RIFCSPLOWO2_12_FULL_57_18]|nr:MAG: NADH-quinone oxidoreductase subunit G [Gallionellales bacterium RIFCSPLOWO2_12_FULL_57_18]OGS95025.1 MAG: NADH-quinone oxidoreductase subunit G [Gallionellales bacterium RIFCSPLOWO2_02_FULL_57_47]OGT11636.1 MAG: NADH-quinone oxidoreductase subunit G [Gallionellales bacterium RIFCSPHIGHO2_02_FULL_57_16]